MGIFFLFSSYIVLINKCNWCNQCNYNNNKKEKIIKSESWPVTHMTNELCNRGNSLIINNLNKENLNWQKSGIGIIHWLILCFANIIRCLQLRMVVVVDEGGKGNDLHMAKGLGFWVWSSGICKRGFHSLAPMPPNRTETAQIRPINFF